MDNRAPKTRFDVAGMRLTRFAVATLAVAALFPALALAGPPAPTGTGASRPAYGPVVQRDPAKVQGERQRYLDGLSDALGLPRTSARPISQYPSAVPPPEAPRPTAVPEDCNCLADTLSMDDRLQRQSVDQRTAAEIAKIKEYSARFLREQEAIREQHYCGQGQTKRFDWRTQTMTCVKVY